MTVISPQILFKNGIEYLLAREADIRFVNSGDHNNGIEQILENTLPDIVIIDYDNEPELCLDITRRIKQRLPNVGIIIFSSNINDDALFACMNSRASAYLSKESTRSEIIKTIEIVADGCYPINDSLHTNPRIAEQILTKFQELSEDDETQRLVSPLTGRETEVLRYIANGYVNKQIAADLEISEHTIKNHITSILRKLDANARTEAVVIGVRQGIITID